MANPEHLAILEQGVNAWNKWRDVNLGIRSNLSGADLRRADLRKASLFRAYLSGANLRKAILREANLRKAILSWADLSGADLSGMDLSGAQLEGTNLSGANLEGTNLRGANLRRADLSYVHIYLSKFGDVDLSKVEGLETVNHYGPSTIGIDTIFKSRGNIPNIFLKKAGVPQALIDHIPSYVNKPWEYYSCFVSYSSKNQDFADRLYNDLQGKGVRCWLATEDLEIGDRFRQVIDQAIRSYDKLLIVLSETSVESEWVEDEVEAGLEKERKQKRDVLFPVQIDDAVMKTDEAWAAKIRRARHIGDFTNWKDHDSYQKAFDRLLRALNTAPSEVKKNKK
jgi:hypothetical protein